MGPERLKKCNQKNYRIDCWNFHYLRLGKLYYITKNKKGFQIRRISRFTRSKISFKSLVRFYSCFDSNLLFDNYSIAFLFHSFRWKFTSWERNFLDSLWNLWRICFGHIFCKIFIKFHLFFIRSRFSTSTNL